MSILVCRSRLLPALSHVHHSSVALGGMKSSIHIDAPKNLASLEVRTNSQNVVVSNNQIHSGYQKLHQRFQSLVWQTGLTAFTSPVSALAWSIFWEMPVMDSAMAKLVLVAGSAIMSNRAIHLWNTQRAIAYSMVVDENGPSKSEDANEKIRKIIAGPDPKISVNFTNLTVSGPMGSLDKPSSFLEDTRSHIFSIKRISLPKCVLNSKANGLRDLVLDRWMSFVTLPASILNLVSGYEEEHKKLDHYVMMAIGAEGTWDFLNGLSRAKARKVFTKFLDTAETTPDIAKLLINEKSLNGEMRYLAEWCKSHREIAVRIGRTGTIILYDSSRTQSFGGPYPIKVFPSQLPRELRE